MATIKDFIQSELLKMIEEERTCIHYRKANADHLEERYQIKAEENFLEKLERFAKSI